MTNFSRDYNRDIIVSQPTPTRARLTLISKPGYPTYNGGGYCFDTDFLSYFGYEGEHTILQQFYLLFNSNGVFYDVEAVHIVYDWNNGDLVENNELTQFLNDWWEEYGEIFIIAGAFGIRRYDISDQLNYSIGTGTTGPDSFVMDGSDGSCIEGCAICWEVT